MKDGHINDCKPCRNSYDKKRVQTFGKEKHKISQKKYKTKLRKELLAAYGGKCACCGETTEEFLELDHINGDGAKQRKEVGRDICRILKKLGYPKKEYRLLCANCNHSFGMKGYCPHQR